MTETQTATVEWELSMREEPQDGYIATFYGRAVPYDTETVIGPGMRERFARDAFDPSDVIGQPIHYPHKTPVGVITAAHNKEDGLYITGGILDTAQGRDAAVLLRAKAVRFLSVEFMSTVSKYLDRARTAVEHTKVRSLGAALTYMPAYPTAGIVAVREEAPMTETATVGTAEVPAMIEDREARDALAELRSRVDAFETASDPVHELAQYRDMQSYAKALASGVESRTVNVSAISEQTGLVPPTWLTDIKGVLDRGRPCINAIGGPMSAGDSGLVINWPSFAGDLSAIAAAHSEGAEPNSADIDIVVGTATLGGYASYNNLTWEVINRTAPSYVQAHARILMGAYGTETDYAFQAGLWANDVIATGIDYASGSDTTGSLFLNAVWQAATEVEFATGQPAEVVYVSSAIWALLPTWSEFKAQNYPVQNVGGVFNGRALSASVLGLPVVLAREFATDGSEDAIVTNRLACGWAEDGPQMVAAETPSVGGRDVAIHGLGVFTPFVANGIRSIYNAA